MQKCKNCGGMCKSIGRGQYQCDCCGNVFYQEQSTSSMASDGASLFDENINGVLEIAWREGIYINSGSGFLINKEGYCITNTHVVAFDNGKSCGEVSVKINGVALSAEVVSLGDNRCGLGSGVDLALLKLSRMPHRAKVLEIENFNNVKTGESVYVIGNALGYGTCITSGIVSDRLRKVDGKMLLMTDCAINGGNSGGPIFNAQGKVIGAIVSGIDGAEGMKFAIPASTIIEFIKKNGVRI